MSCSSLLSSVSGALETKLDAAMDKALSDADREEVKKR